VASSHGVWATAESTTLQVYIASTAAVALKVDGGISAAGTISNANGIVNNVGGTAMSGNLVGSRALSVVYTNSTGRVLVVYVVVSSPSSGQFSLLVGGVEVYYFSSVPGFFSGTILVPPGSTYEAVSAGSSLFSWYEY